MNTVDSIKAVMSGSSDMLQALGLLGGDAVRPLDGPHFVLVTLKEGEAWIEIRVTQEGLYEISNGPAPQDGRVFHLPLRLSARYLGFITRFGLQPKTSIPPPPKS